MAIVKSNLLKQLSDSYPNFLKKDLEKFLNIILNEIKQALYKGERVELRGFGVWSIHIQKARISRNPKTGAKMSWKNHGLKGWHIDHKIPLNNFNLKKVSEQRKAFNFKNTQPMWSFQNLSKGHRG